MVVIKESDYLAHFGILRKSGRYPWGSGKDPQARGHKFHETIDALKAQGMSQVEIAKSFGMSTTDLRNTTTIANNAIKAANIAQATRLKAEGYSDAEGARKMGIPGTSYRALIAPGEEMKAQKLSNIADELRNHVAEMKYVGIGSGTENYMGISTTRLNAAVAILKDEGYTVHKVPVPQLGTGEMTQVKVLAPPGTTWGEVKKNQNQIREIATWTQDQGETFFHPRLQPPLSIHPDRVDIMYREQGGDKQDGMIYVRPGVKDVSLDQSRYAQVRVLVGDQYYLKGMAVYKDDLPAGKDILFATNKSDTGNKFDAMKKVKDEVPIEANNPFGSSLKRQIIERDADGNEKITSAMNIVNEQGDWTKWSKNLSSQVLSKQSPTLAKAQLDMTFERRQKELDSILKLTNPTVQRELLKKFSEETDAAAVHMEAAALNKRQAYHIILPIATMPPGQIYAPRYKDGETVALIRYPHGGTFEIPELVVNNKHAEARRLLGDVPDAVGIHHTVAERLSGADFDGDQVVVVPNGGSKKIRSTPALEGLKGFDPKLAYPKYPGMKVITGPQKQIEMGIISNLITDMTIKGAPPSELAQAVRHSMVVIDSEKHELNFRQSAINNGIPRLKEKYQRQLDTGKAGSATLISRAGSEVHVPKMKPRPASEGGPIDRKTGALVMVPDGTTRTNKQGERIAKTQKVEKLSITDDAHELSSGTRIERIYADHSNRMKALANSSRLSLVNTPNLKYSPSSAKAYAREVASMNEKLTRAIMNRPLERQAQILGNALYRAKLESNPNVDNESKRKFKNQALTEARHRTNATAHQIKFTQEEWNAIQAGAISDHKLTQMLQKADIKTVRELATPRPKILMTSIKMARAQQMIDSGYTRAQIAEHLGVSLTTLETSLNGE